tara:strand:+ start:39 stop:2684 length:2646 start_codon:yes stop_codon:yes gene_type:complete
MSEIKVNKLSPRSGTAVTLGDSGDTFTIPSGATLAIAGSVTGFTSAGIDDNATSVAITISSDEDVTFTEDILLGDNKKAIFGAGSDLQIYHDGSNSRIDDTGTGNLILRADADVAIQNTAGSASKAVFRTGSGVFLYHDGIKKFETTSAGVDVTGTLTTGAITSTGDFTFNVADGMNINTKESLNINIDTDDNDSSRAFSVTSGSGGTSETLILASEDAGVKLYHDNSEKFETTSSGATVTTTLSGANDLTLQTSDANEKIILDMSGTQRFNVNGSEKMRLTATGLGIGTSSPINKLHIFNTDFQQLCLEGQRPTMFLKETNGNANENFQVRVDGGNLQLQSQDDAQSSATTRLLITQSGNVGIGTSSPNAKLDVRGSAVFNEDGADVDFRVESDTNSNSFFLQGSDGKVGISTGSPVGRLHIFDFSGSGGLRLTRGNNITSNGIHIQTDSTQNYFNAYGNLVFKTNTTGDGTNASERMRILSDGKIGIGDIAPQDLLEVNGSGRGVGGITISNSTHTDAALSFARNSSATARIHITEPGALHTSSLRFQTSDASGGPNLLTAMVIDHNQNVGIGTTSPNGNLEVRGPASDTSQLYISTSTKPNSRIGYIGLNRFGMDIYDGLQIRDVSASFATRFVIDSSGNVGIGTTSTSSDAVNISVADNRVTTGRCLEVHHTKTDTTFSGIVARFQSARNTTNGTYEFIRCAISGVANKFIVTDGGTIQAVNTTISSISDERIKQDIVDANSQWDDIKALKFKNFKKKQAVRDDGDNALKELGVVAQDVESAGMNGLIEMSNPDISCIKSDSSFGTLWTEDDEEVKNGIETAGEIKEIKEKVKTVKYSMIWMKSVKALQEAMERIETLEAKNTELEARITTLEANNP